MFISKHGRTWGAQAAIAVTIVGLALTSCAGFGQIASVGNSVAVPKLDTAQAAAGHDSQPAAMPLTDLYQQVNPSVVNVQVTVRAGGGSDMPSLPQLPGMPNNPFGNHGPQAPQRGQGSGFLFDNQRHVVTNYHVAGQADRISVVFADGSSAAASVVGADPDSDLAVLEVDRVPAGVVPLPIGQGDNLAVGQEVVAIGNPFGLEGTMTTGIISGLGRTLPSQAQTIDGGRFSIPEVVQTDAAINPGNSGGPLLNLKGQVVGVNTAIESSIGQSSGVGFAVPAATVARIVPVLIANGSYAHPWLGVAVRDMSPSLANAMDLPRDTRGVIVQQVVPDGPADKAGLQASDRQVTIDGVDTQVGGDVILSMNGQPIQSVSDLLAYLENETSVGDQVQVGLLRGGKQIQQALNLQGRPSGQ
ncbi:MAG: trypsin-like peptidase domain-containing protein [Anaerolineales bacterium]